MQIDSDGLTLPKPCTPEFFNALPSRKVLYYFSANEGIEASPKMYFIKEAIPESYNSSGVFSTFEEAKAFEFLYESGQIEFVGGTWVMKKQAPTVEQLTADLLAANAELSKAHEEIRMLKSMIHGKQRGN